MVQYKPSAQEILDRKSYGQGSRARFDPQWAMSRPTDWYQNRDNLSLVKDTLVRQPAVTTDQNESRNMYQMLMNQIRGGGGAQLLDTSGIPAGARRIGRTLFQDPSKSAGFKADLRNMFGDLTFQNKRLPPEKRTSNPAAVRAPVHNVFGNFGQKGKDFYKKEFPIQSGLNTLMDKAGSMMPYASWLSKLLPKRKKEIIPRNPMFSPENNPWGLPWELLEENVTETVDDGNIWESASAEKVDFVPTDDDIKEAYEYIFKDNAYSDEYVGNSAIIDTTVPSFEQYLAAMQNADNYEYINSILETKAKAEEMGLI